MTFGVRPAAITIACAAFVCAAIATAADLQDDTSRAYDNYAEQATRAFVARTRGVRSSADLTASRARAPASGDVMARPAREDGIMSVPGGLVHHWAGSTFIAGVTMKDALDVSSRYHWPYQALSNAAQLGHRAGRAASRAKQLERSLQEFSRAVRTRARQGGSSDPP